MSIKNPNFFSLSIRLIRILLNQYPDIEQQSGQMKRLNSQQFNSAQSPQQLTREVGITDGPKAALPLKKRSHFQSMNSTNVNSGSESTIEADGESKNALCPLTSTRFLKKDDSLMHPSSPSKIQIDSAPKYNNKPLIKRKTSSSANSNNSVVTTEGAKKSHVPTFNDQFDVAVMLRKLWATHKGSVYSVLKTIFVLVVLIMLKRALQRLIPPALLAKIKSFLL